MDFPEQKQLLDAEPSVNASDFMKMLSASLEQLGRLCKGEALHIVRSLQCSVHFMQQNDANTDDGILQWLRMVDNELVTILLELHPDITTMELKVCVMLHHQMSTKDICTLLNLSPRSVENHRYRLRKKLRLNRKDSVCSYLSRIRTSASIQETLTYYS